MGKQNSTGTYQNLLLEARNGVGIVWLNRPELRNALNADMVRELKAALRQLEQDDSVRAIVLAAAGEAFCAGADLNGMKAMAQASRAQNLASARESAALWHSIDRLRKPIIARVHGAAIAGGMGLVAACDMAIASTDASFSLSETRLGLLPATVGPYVLRAIGMRSMRRYALSAERFNAAEAYRIGLVHDLCPPEELDGRINDLLGALMDCAPGAIAACKDLLRALDGRAIDDALMEDTAHRIADIRASAEGREGIQSFLERRDPWWRGSETGSQAAPRRQTKKTALKAAPKPAAKKPVKKSAAR
jgi:methylglutaconyl-CoA hydratase